MLHAKAKRGSGGIGCFVRTQILQTFKVDSIDSSHEGIIPASKEYGTHMGPRWVIIWVLYAQPIWDRCGFCNRDSSGTHMGTSIWAPYGPHIEFPI